MPSYASLADLTTLGISAAALAGISSDDQQTALDAASATADGYLRNRFQLPLIAPYPLDLRAVVCSIAAWTLLKTRGFDPENPADNAIQRDKRDAMEWLEQVRDGKIDPGVIDSQEGGTFEEQGGPFVLTMNPDGTTGSPKPRGW